MPEYTRNVQYPLPCTRCEKRWLLVTNVLQLFGHEVTSEDVLAAIAERRVEVVGSSGGVPVCYACRGNDPGRLDHVDLPSGLEHALNEWWLQKRFLRHHLEGAAKGRHEAMTFIAKKVMGHKAPRYDLERHVRQTLLEFAAKEKAGEVKPPIDLPVIETDED